MQLTVHLWLEDRPGALMRVAGIITGKGYNIIALSLAPDPCEEGVSRMTITADVEERLHIRVVNEMNRLVNVLHAVNGICGELSVPQSRVHCDGAHL